jgi:hypothetical protein
MKWIKCAAVFGLLISSIPRSAGAQVLKEIPNSSWFVLKVSNLEATSKKLADLCNTMGIVQMAPEMADPLGAFLKSMGAPEGVDRGGELALCYIDPAVSKAPQDKSVVLLMPVADYDKFTANFADAKPDGNLVTCHFKNDPNPDFIGHWGNYAACSPSRDIVAAAPTDTMQVAGLAAKEFDGKDFVLYANMNALRPTMQQQLANLRQNLSADIDKAVRQNPKVGNMDSTKLAPVANVVGTQLLDVADRLTADVSAATVSFNLGQEGIAETASAEFTADSKTANYIKGIKNTDDSMLEGLADGKYLMFGGQVSDPQQASKLVGDFLAPIEASITTLGPDYAPINDWLNALQKLVGASTGAAFGWIAPTAAPGQGALMQMVQIHRGDAKTTLQATYDMTEAQIAAMKAFGVTTPGAMPKYIPAAKTVDGVAFDEMDTPMNAMGGQGAQQQQMTQIMSMIYGPQGPAVFSGVVDDKNMLTVLGLDDAGISKAIAAVKAGESPLANLPGVKTVSGELPPQRLAALYVPLDLWATTGLSYAKQFGMDMGVTLPDNLPPVGVTVSTDADAGALRYDAYIPTQLIQAVTSAGIQIYTKMQAPPPQNNAPAGGGGM